VTDWMFATSPHEETSVIDAIQFLDQLPTP